MTSQFLSPIWKIDWLADPLFSFKASVQIESWRVTFNPSRDLGHKFKLLRGGCWGAAGRVPLSGLLPRRMPDPGASTEPSGKWVSFLPLQLRLLPGAEPWPLSVAALTCWGAVVAPSPAMQRLQWLCSDPSPVPAGPALAPQASAQTHSHFR